jgi:hypothetical protein
MCFQAQAFHQALHIQAYVLCFHNSSRWFQSSGLEPISKAARSKARAMDQTTQHTRMLTHNERVDGQNHEPRKGKIRICLQSGAEASSQVSAPRKNQGLFAKRSA